MNNYTLAFSDHEIEEIEALGCTTAPQPRIEWIRIAQIALGKVVMLEQGYYDDEGDDNEEVVESWIDDLQGIADKILSKFKPGDGQI